MINRTITALTILLQSVPVGTNLALLNYPWMLVSGELLPNRGAMIPVLSK